MKKAKKSISDVCQ